MAQITSLKPGCSIHVKLPDGRPGVVKTKPTVLHYVGEHIRVNVDKADNLDVCLLSLIENRYFAFHMLNILRKIFVNVPIFFCIIVNWS